MTTFGKKNVMGGAPATMPGFGKKTSAPTVHRAPPPANDRLSPEALAFLQSERKRAPVGPAQTARPAQSAYAAPRSDMDYGLGNPVWGRRVVARLVDEFGVWFLILAVFYNDLSKALSVYIAAPQGSPAEASASVTLFGYAVIFMIIQSAYNIIMEASATQATLGKMLVGAQVTARDGSKPSLGKVIMRNTVGRFVVNLVPVYAGYLMGLFNKERRCLHDMMSGTVVRKRVTGGAATGYGEVFA